MIRLTRLNHQSVVLNSDLIKLIEAAPDTVITLVNGEKIIVRESVDQVLERIVEFRRRLLAAPPLGQLESSDLPAATSRNVSGAVSGAGE